MGKKKEEASPKSVEPKEGHKLLGAPTFKPLENGRFKCVETGHELPAHARDSYADSKHCRLGLIDSALARNKTPLNMFRQDPASRSKLECKLTGLTINKSEEHIWKHINGKRFLNSLEKFEAGEEIPSVEVVKPDEDKEKKLKTKKKKDGSSKKEKKEEEVVDVNVNAVRDSADKSSDAEDEDDDFWMPPEGERWDHDDGGDRWSDDSEPETDADGGEEGDEEVEHEVGGELPEEVEHEVGELSNGTKRMSLEIEPSSLAPNMKKRKTKT